MLHIKKGKKQTGENEQQRIGKRDSYCHLFLFLNEPVCMLISQKLTKSLVLPSCRIFQHPSGASSVPTCIVWVEESYQRICTRLGLPTVPSVASCFAAGILVAGAKKKKKRPHKGTNPTNLTLSYDQKYYLR